MKWFYGQLDTVWVNSEEYRQSWIDHGIAPERLQILPRGLDTELFTPTRRDPLFWERFGDRSREVRLLYVGRISKEKDLDLLASAYRKVREEGLRAQLSIVGIGPYAETLAQALPEACFTGFLKGADLATAYASADVFVFPSTTDTFGNVVIEAQAAGLPVIVSDAGGPKELVQHGVNGLITRANDVESFAAALRQLIRDEGERARMSAAARRSVIDRSWPEAFRKFWEASAG